MYNRRLAAADSGVASGNLSLSFNLPHQSVYDNKEVDKVSFLYLFTTLKHAHLVTFFSQLPFPGYIMIL